MTSSSLSKEPIRQALLVAEDLEEQFAPIASTPRDPIALLPLGDSTLIDHTLHTLKTGGIQQVLVCCSQLNQVREHLLANNWFRPATGAGDTPFVHLFPAEGLCSLGDVMREVFSSSQHLKQNDFVLVNGFVIGQVPLAQLLSEHVRRRADQDKGCALTLVMRPLDSAHPAHQYESRPLLVINRNGGKLLHFEPAVGSTLMRKPKDSLKSLKSWDHIRLPLERLRASHSLQIRTDLHETGLAICSPAIPALFVDNFDYSTRDELMHGLLVHEELLGSTLYVQTSPSANKLIGRVHNWRSYERLASDLMRGWLDLGSILSIGSTSSALDRIRLTHRVGVWRSANAHVQPNVELSGHVMLGSQCDIGDSVRLHNCMLTGPCCVGQRSVLTGTYALNDVSVGSDCRLDRCVLGSGVRILDGCHVPDGCLLGSGVQIGPNVRLPTGTRLVIQSANDSAQTIDVSLVGAKGNAILWSDDGDFNSLQNLNEDEEDDDLTDDDDDESESGYRAKSQLWGLEQGQSDTWKCDYESEDTDDDDELDDSDNDLPAAQIDNGVPSGDDAHDQSSDPSDDDMDEDSKNFYREVLDSLQRGLEEKISCTNLVLEVNCSKHAYNVPIRELIVLVVKAVLDLPIQLFKGVDERQYLEQISQALAHLIPLLNNYTRSTDSQKDCLASIEHFAACNFQICSPNVLVRILLKLYESDVLSDETIIEWHRTVTTFPSPLNNSPELSAIQRQLRESKPLLKLIDWLEQEQEDDESEESD